MLQSRRASSPIQSARRDNAMWQWRNGDSSRQWGRRCCRHRRCCCRRPAAAASRRCPSAAPGTARNCAPMPPLPRCTAWRPQSDQEVRAVVCEAAKRSGHAAPCTGAAAPRPVAGFSVVKVATERSTGRHWACKIMTLPRPGASPSRSRRGAIMREIDVLLDLEHPNVVGMKEYFVEHNKVYLIMELLRGEAARARAHVWCAACAVASSLQVLTFGWCGLPLCRRRAAGRSQHARPLQRGGCSHHFHAAHAWRAVPAFKVSCVGALPRLHHPVRPHADRRATATACRQGRGAPRPEAG